MFADSLEHGERSCRIPEARGAPLGLVLVRRFESGFSRQHLHMKSVLVVVVVVAGVVVVVGGVVVRGQAGVGLFWLGDLQLCRFWGF